MTSTVGPTPGQGVPPPPLDQSQRDRISRALDETLFVQAAAGSGKTRALVERIAQLVVTGTAGLEQIAAITFTEKAAAELRDRVRRRLDDELATATSGDAASAGSAGTTAGPPAGQLDLGFEASAGSHVVAERCRAALDELDSAAIGTLHSFAQRLLTEHPIEAGLPPRVEVLDEVASAVEFDDRWSRFVDRLLADPAVEHALLLATAAGVRLDHLRLIALAFDQNWDLAVDHAPASPVDIDPWEDELALLLDEAELVCAEREQGGDDDALCAHLGEFEQWVRRVRDASDESSRLALLGPRAGRGSAHRRLGNSRNWPGVDLASLRERCIDLHERIEALSQRVVDQAVRRLAHDLRRFTLESADERRAAGELEFHDLLVLSRRMLRDPQHGHEVRGSLHRRYRHLLIDEFQDTDPIQVDLAVLIGAVPDAGPTTDPAGPRSRRCDPPRRCRRGTPSTPAPATCSSSATPSSRSTGSAGPTSRCSCRRPPASAPATRASRSPPTSARARP